MFHVHVFLAASVVFLGAKEGEGIQRPWRGGAET